MIYMKQFKKTVKKVFRKARGKAINRYFNKGYSPKIPQMLSDIKMVKNMLNAEKKQISATISGQLMGQVNVNTVNYRTFDITPVPPQGAGQGQRNGNSIKITSSYAMFQLYGQTAPLTCDMRVRFYIIIPNIAQSSPASFITTIFENSTWSGIVDYNSQLNPNYRDQYKIVRKFDKVIKAGTLSTSVSKTDFQLPMKWNHHVRFQADGSQALTGGQVLLLALCDSGNQGGSNSTLSNIPVTAASSGAYINFDWNWFYYDN